jgi:electron transfer flavoprotein alpha subunit
MKCEHIADEVLTGMSCAHRSHRVLHEEHPCGQPHRVLAMIPLVFVAIGLIGESQHVSASKTARIVVAIR